MILVLSRQTTRSVLILAGLKGLRWPRSKRGVYPVVTFPSYIYYDWSDQVLSTMFHTYATYEEGGRLCFVTRGFGDQGPMYYTALEFEKMRFQWTRHLSSTGFQVDLLLHTLTPEPLAP